MPVASIQSEPIKLSTPEPDVLVASRQGTSKETAVWPKITIVTPSFNQGRYIEAAILSVLQQGYANLEYIIHDAGSSDGSLEVLKRYETSLTRLVVERDRGPADAINRGFASATGDIFAWLNADDLLLPGTLQIIGRVFAEQPAVALVFGEGWYIDEIGNRLEPCRFVRRQFDRRYIVNRDPILQPAAFWRRSLWETTGPLNTSLRWVFDWEWFIRASAQHSFYYLPRDLACYRVQPEALTRTGGMARRLEHGRVTRRYGAWWHPNHIVQQTRRVEAAGIRLTTGWPLPLAATARLPITLARLTAEWVLRGMYMN